ncbi:hypothetical protein PAPYR_8111 [Paratrimastix pyriformis]|uniref:Uncharacterized protein n=1 Tax=Paratrimastix pyriformis TaxID=342808 RepID=A0ABQ8UBG0_9EUKA|nr:hypothetical protein PAPYR_8111 [Paratrimastix pyriformis]
MPIVEAAPFPLEAYCQLIGLTHDIRTAIRGAPRELSFQYPVFLDKEFRDPEDMHCVAPCLPADALAAIVGPCKGLVRLTLPLHNSAHPSVLGCGLFDPKNPGAALAPWADETFGGHNQLAVLEIPGAATFWPVICLILPHLPGLEEFHFLHARPLHSGVLVALAASCPRLRVLHLTRTRDAVNHVPNFLALRPLAGTIKELILPDCDLESGGLGSLVAELPILERLEVNGGNLSSRRRPATQRLTRIVTCHLLTMDADLDRKRLSRLETLASESSRDEAYAPVVTACRDTLKSIWLFSGKDDICPGRGLMAALGGLTHLTRFKLALRSERCTLSAVLASLPPQLVEKQLEYFCLYLIHHNSAEPGAVQLRSSSLREVDLELSLPETCTLTLACSALEKLTLPDVPADEPYQLVMDCPRLHALTRLRDHDLSHTTAMPLLVEEVGGSHHKRCLDPDWLARLMAWSPRLRQVSSVVLSPGMLAQLFVRCPSLVRLRDLRLETRSDPAASLLLQFPKQFEYFDGSVEEGQEVTLPAELRVEAPGLRVLHLTAPPQVQLTLACPALVALKVTARSPVALVEGTHPPLRSLCLERTGVSKDCFDPKYLLAILTHHGSRLQRVSLPSVLLPPGGGAWPQVATALEQLPQLRSLELGGPAVADLALACPHLSHLAIYPTSTYTYKEEEGDLHLRSLVLNCPQLEELRAPVGTRLVRFELGDGGKPTAAFFIEDVSHHAADEYHEEPNKVYWYRGDWSTTLLRGSEPVGLEEEETIRTAAAAPAKEGA